MALNVTTAVFGENCNTATASPSLAQWDKGQVLQISGVDLPDAYQVEFSTVYTRNAIPVIGNASGVQVPNELLQRSAPITACVVLHSTANSRDTEYWVTIHITPRKPPETITPDPEQQDVIDQAIAALQDGTARAEAAATAAAGSATEADGNAENAEAWAVGQRAGEDVPDTDPTYRNNAKYYAGAAEAAAEEAGQHEASWETWVQRAESAADDAEGSARAAAGSKADAEAAAQTATQQATAAGNSATAAAGSAAEARQTVDGGVGAINTARDGALSAIGTARTNAVGNVNQAGAAQVTAVNQAGATQAQAVEDKGAEVLDSIPQDYSELVDDVADLSRQLSDETTGLDTKAPVILETASGAIASFDDGADSMPVKKLVAQIEPVQEGTGDPSPDNVRPISGWTGANLLNANSNFITNTPLRRISNASISTSTGKIGSSNYTDLLVYPIPKTKIWLRKPSSEERFDGRANNPNLVKGEACDVSIHTRWQQLNEFDNVYSYAYVTVPKADNFPNISISTYAPSAVLPIGNSTILSIAFTDPTTGDPLTIYGGTVTLNEDGSADVAADTIIYDLSTAFTYYPEAYQIDAAIRFGRGNTNLSVTPIGKVKSNVLTTTTVASLGDRPTYSYYYKSSNYYPAELKLPAEYNTDAKVKAFLRDVDGNGTHAMLLVNLATPQTYHISNIGKLKTFLGTNNVWVDTGDVEVTYPADTKLYIDSLTAPDEDMIADANIASGQYFTVNNKLYLSTAAIAAGASIVPGTNCTETNLAAALNALNT